MSKSLGNFFTVREISEKYDLQVLRFFMLSAHYRSPLNFSADLMAASKNGLDRILTAVARLDEMQGTDATLTDAEKEAMTQIDEFVKKYEAAMEDDFNTADAVSAIFELVKYTNINVTNDSSKELVAAARDTIKKLCDVLGIITEREEELLDADIEKLIEERQAARKAKDFARADEIRDLLAAQGILLKDTREGVKWSRA
jgi:cysteinyl-tRNA synthetase